jgi:Mn-dependent DtxR family transcriptional regulator
MTDAPPVQDLQEQIMALFRSKKKMMTSRDVAKALDANHREVKKALTDLVNEGTLEFTSYGGATFIKLPDETA